MKQNNFFRVLCTALLSFVLFGHVHAQTLQVILSPDKSKVDRSTSNGVATVFFDSNIEDLSIVCTDQNPDEPITKIGDNLWFTHIDVKKDIEADGVCYRNYLLNCAASAEYYLTTDEILPNQVLYYTITLPNELEPKLQEEKARNLATKVNQLVDDGDSYTARLLALQALSEPLPYTYEAEMSLRKAMAESSTILRDHHGQITSMCFSPNGQFVLSCSEDSTAKLWDVNTGCVLKTLSGHNKSLISGSFSPDGKKIVTSSNDSTLRIWEISTGQTIKVFPMPSIITSSSYSPDGKQIVTTAQDVTVRVCDASTGAITNAYQFNEFYPYHINYSPNGNQIILNTISDSALLVVLNSKTGKELYRLKGHNKFILAYACSPDCKLIATASMDSTLRVWDATTGKNLYIFRSKYPNWMVSTAFINNGDAVMGIALDKTVTIWSTKTGKELLTTQEEISTPTTRIIDPLVALSPGANRMVCYSNQNIAWLREVLPGPNYRKYQFDNLVADATYSPAGDRIAVALSNNGIKILDAKTGKSLCSLIDKEKNDYKSISYSRDGKYIASTSLFFKKDIRIWDTKSLRLCDSLYNNRSWGVYTASFSPDGKHIVSDNQSDVCIWDIVTGEEHTLPGHTNLVLKTCYNPDGSIIASASIDNTVRLWDSTTYDCLKVLREHSDNVNDIAFSPDGELIASASVDGSIKLWDVESGKVVHTLNGHLVDVKSIAFNPDGKTLISCGRDKKIIVWDVQKGQQLYSWRNYSKPYSSLSFSPDGHSILACSNNSIYIWDFPPLEDLIKETRERFKDRQLTPEEKVKYNIE